LETFLSKILINSQRFIAETSIAETASPNGPIPLQTLPRAIIPLLSRNFNIWYQSKKNLRGCTFGLVI